MSGKFETRKNKVLSLLNEKGTLSNAELAELFDLSPASVRRFSAELAEDDSVIRIRGGLRIAPHAEPNYSFDSQSQEYTEEKHRIAELACRYVRDDQIIFLESGTTVYQCALALTSRIRSSSLKNVTIFTNSLNNLYALSPVCKVMLVGGEYRAERSDFVGYLCERFLRTFCFDHVFLGLDAISACGDLMAMDFDTARICETLLQHANSVTVVAHSAKFSKNSLLPFASLDDVARVVTDSDLSDEEFLRYSLYSAELLRA